MVEQAKQHYFQAHWHHALSSTSFVVEMEKKALINDVSYVLQWRFTLKEDTAHCHSKALHTNTHYTVLHVLKGILTSWAQFIFGERSSNSTSKENPSFNLALYRFFCGFVNLFLSNELQKKQICSWKWKISMVYAGTDIAIGNSYYDVFARLHH